MGTMVNDRFHLGGPTSVRGFEPFGLGLKEKGEWYLESCVISNQDVTPPSINRRLIRGELLLCVWG